MTALEFHPLAEIFPLIEGYEFAGLVDDIRSNGLREPVVLYQGRVLDGRNRLRACEAAGIACRFETYAGDDPVAYVVSLNLRRRHLDESQRAMVAAKLATLRRGDNQHSPIGETSQAEAAELLNVGKRSVERAREVQEHGAPELVHAVEQGKVSVSAAADVAALPASEQVEIIARGEREILKAASEIRARKAEVRHAERIARLAGTSNVNSPMPLDCRYPVIYADPPWRFFAFGENAGFSGQAADHYPSMTVEEICAQPVPATDDAVLFLWAVNAELPGALAVIKAWGFEYKTNVAWVKPSISLGHFVRNQHELLLIATRGDIPCPLPANRPGSVIEAGRREHSRKPDEAYELIERMYPDLPKIELFARNAREGWAAWGNEISCEAVSS